MYADTQKERLNPPRLNIGMPWIESPLFENEIETCDASEELKTIARQLNRDGIAVFDPKISDFSSVSNGIVDGLKPHYDPSCRLTNAWEFSTPVQTLANTPYVLEVLRFLYRRNPIPYQTLNFSVGTQQRTHSDSIHFASVPSRYMCGVWVALEDTDENNGPLHYYPGSHRLPIIGLEDIGIDKTVREIPARYAIYEDFIESYVKSHRLERKELPLKKGQAVIWAANVLHGGSPIRDKKRSRHSQVTHYFFEDCQYYAPVQSTVFLGRIQFIGFRNILDGKKISQPKPPWINHHRLTTRHAFRRVMKFLHLPLAEV